MQRYDGYSRILATGAPAPSATVTVYNAGTLTPATIYSDNLLSPTPLGNPFTADVNGYFFFYAVEGAYDINFSGSGIVTPYSWGDQTILGLDDAIQFGAAHMVPIQADFYGSVPNGSLGPLALSGGTSPGQLSVANHPGVATITSHTANANSGFFWGVAIIAPIAGGEQFEVVFRIDRLTNVTSHIGLHNSFTVAAPTNGIYFVIPATGQIVGRTTAASVNSSTSTLATLALATWYRARFTVNATGTSVTFAVYSEAGVLLGTGTLTTNIPTAGGQDVGCSAITFLSVATGSAESLLSLDYLGATYDRVLSR